MNLKEINMKPWNYFEITFNDNSWELGITKITGLKLSGTITNEYDKYILNIFIPREKYQTVLNSSFDCSSLIERKEYFLLRVNFKNMAIMEFIRASDMIEGL
ncbi:MAG: hypothetical protein QXZ44_03270, partial [Ferroplasma sp.]